MKPPRQGQRVAEVPSVEATARAKDAEEEEAENVYKSFRSAIYG